jgi:hypothetical protein
MGSEPTDKINSGARRTEQFSIAMGLDSSSADQVGGEAKRALGFRILKNALVDKRLGAVVKRPGSLTETIDTGLGTPLGVGEYLEAADGSIPLKRTLLANFSSAWKQRVAETWSDVSVSSYTNFSTTRQTQFAKIGDNMFIAGGLPAKWGGPGTQIDRIGIEPPTTAISTIYTPDYLTVNSGIVLTQGTQYMYTFYDSATGLESDWSELSTSTGAKGSGTNGIPFIRVTIPTHTAQNWDKIKLYRTLDGGQYPYLVATLDAGTTTYTDTLRDAQLTQAAEPRYERATPPERSFLCAKYAQCLWMVDADNPYKVVFSKPYTGSDVDLEYFPVDNYVITNEPVTALYVVPGKMLLFHPRSISYVSGFSVSDFVLQTFVPGVGTLFPNSISSSGNHIVWLAEQGLVALRFDGRTPFHISREIDEELQPLLAAFYNDSIYVSSCWNVSLRQFIFVISASSLANAQWEDVDTGSTTSADAGWEDANTSVEDFWEDADNPDAEDARRVKIWGWSPELTEIYSRNIWHEYTFSDIADNNEDGAFPVFVFHPQPSSDTSDPQQDKTFLGFFDGTEGGIKTIFRRDRSTDDGQSFTSVVVTDRIAPGIVNGGYKLFQALGFANSYSDPTSSGTATIKYLKDFDDPQLRSYTGSLISLSDSTDAKKFPQMLARHIHLYVEDSSQSLSKVLLSEFFIHFRERFRREGR